jgi:hypothetical protein
MRQSFWKSTMFELSESFKGQSFCASMIPNKTEPKPKLSKPLIWFGNSQMLIVLIKSRMLMAHFFHLLTRHPKNIVFLMI